MAKYKSRRIKAQHVKRVRYGHKGRLSKWMKINIGVPKKKKARKLHYYSRNYGAGIDETISKVEKEQKTTETYRRLRDYIWKKKTAEHIKDEKEELNDAVKTFERDQKDVDAEILRQINKIKKVQTTGDEETPTENAALITAMNRLKEVQQEVAKVSMSPQEKLLLRSLQKEGMLEKQKKEEMEDRLRLIEKLQESMKKHQEKLKENERKAARAGWNTSWEIFG